MYERSQSVEGSKSGLVKVKYWDKNDIRHPLPFPKLILCPLSITASYYLEDVGNSHSSGRVTAHQLSFLEFMIAVIYCAFVSQISPLPRRTDPSRCFIPHIGFSCCYLHVRRTTAVPHNGRIISLICLTVATIASFRHTIGSHDHRSLYGARPLICAHISSHCTYDRRHCLLVSSFPPYRSSRLFPAHWSNPSVYIPFFPQISHLEYVYYLLSTKHGKRVCPFDNACA